MQIAIIDGYDLTREALEKAVITTWDEFAKANGDSLSSDEATDLLADLHAGKIVKGGGGASAEYTLMSESRRYALLCRKRILTEAQAKADGFIVDRHVYPWYGYKGARFANHEPYNTVEVLTWREADLATALRKVLKALRSSAGPEEIANAEQEARTQLLAIGIDPDKED